MSADAPNWVQSENPTANDAEKAPRPSGYARQLLDFVNGAVLFFVLRIVHRKALRDILGLGKHLERVLFPRMRRAGKHWLRMSLETAPNTVRFVSSDDDPNLDFSSLEYLAQTLAKIGVKNISLDTRLEHGQIGDAFLLLFFAAPKFKSEIGSPHAGLGWPRSRLAVAMVSPKGLHKFCSTMRFRRGTATYEVQHTYCELLLSRVVKSMITRFSSSGDHRALFTAAPYVSVAFVVLIGFAATAVAFGHQSGAIALALLGVMLSLGLGIAVYIMGALQYTLDHQLGLADGYANRIEELLSQVEASYEKLQTLEMLRDDLVNMVVHDMKNPIFGITGYLDILSESLGSRLDDKERGYFRELKAFSYRLLEMVGSIVDVRRLEEGKMPVHVEPCDLSSRIDEAIALLRPLAKGKVLERSPDEQPVIAICDADLIERVIGNLVSNAITYTPAGGSIRVCMACSGETVRTSVTDTGHGIAAEDMNRIFDRFARVGKGGNRSYSTGLGLTFCRLAVETNGGVVGASSQEGKGSCFWFELPLAASQKGVTSGKQEDRTKGQVEKWRRKSCW